MGEMFLAHNTGGVSQVEMWIGTLFGLCALGIVVFVVWLSLFDWWNRKKRRPLPPSEGGG